ncbi:AmpG family muropeptide MFS transporter, partial [Enterobacter roggenkampii]
ANLWGYRSAMVAAGSGAVLVAAWADWTWAYLAIAVSAFIPFPILAAMRPETEGATGRASALVTGITTGLAILITTGLATAGIG